MFNRAEFSDRPYLSKQRAKHLHVDHQRRQGAAASSAPGQLGVASGVDQADGERAWDRRIAD